MNIHKIDVWVWSRRTVNNENWPTLTQRQRREKLKAGFFLTRNLKCCLFGWTYHEKLDCVGDVHEPNRCLITTCKKNISEYFSLIHRFLLLFMPVLPSDYIQKAICNLVANIFSQTDKLFSKALFARSWITNSWLLSIIAFVS